MSAVPVPQLDCLLWGGQLLTVLPVLQQGQSRWHSSGAGRHLSADGPPTEGLDGVRS